MQPPGVAWIRSYRRGWLRGDIIAGATVAAYAVPQLMAYAELAGLPAVVGLWAVLVPVVVYALLGSSRQLSVGPESTTALLTAVAVAPVAAGDPARFAALAAALAVIVSGLCLLAWVFRLGAVANLFSRPVLVGYLAGVAVLMIVGQLTKITGVPTEGESPAAVLSSFFDNIDQAQGVTVGVSAGVLAFLYLMRWRAPRWPGPLLAVLAAAVAGVVFGLQDRGLDVVGEIDAALPSLTIPAVTAADLRELLPAAIGLTVIAYTDNVLTARSFAARRGQVIDVNGEFAALGMANLGAGLTQGMPVSSSGSRTAIGDASGSTTQLSSLVMGLLVLVTLFALQPVLAEFPTAALGALVVYAATLLVDVAAFRRLWRFRRVELVLALVTTTAVIALDLLIGVAVAVGLSVLAMLARVSHPHDGVLGIVPDMAGMHDVADYPHAREVPGLLVYRYDAPLFFGNAEDFRRRALGAVAHALAAGKPVRWFLLNAEANVEVDITGLDAVESVRTSLAEQGIVLALARVKQDLLVELERFGLIRSIGAERVFPTLPTAVEAYYEWCRQADAAPDGPDAASDRGGRANPGVDEGCREDDA